MQEISARLRTSEMYKRAQTHTHFSSKTEYVIQVNVSTSW